MLRSATPPHSSTFCPDNWMPFQGSCYFFHHTEQSFTEAQHACLQRNSNLVQIDSIEENLFIKEFLSQQKQLHWWIGLSDEDIEGIWKWVGSDDKPTYTDWYPGEPNNVSNNEDCAITSGLADRNFRWIDIACSNLHYSICELKSETSGTIIVG
ncbi:hepatic lectin-like isoform X2 [Dreissena polymorpha]|uniref:hepatic lectin-like isoform X2 n=1 Tax=Dreissena polymorpha TaxID=45954 RepID=UPI00226512B3|nr:hepatic lectin-like isoform X2 [Dreissena polymorpha]